MKIRNWQCKVMLPIPCFSKVKTSTQNNKIMISNDIKIPLRNLVKEWVKNKL